MNGQAWVTSLGFRVSGLIRNSRLETRNCESEVPHRRTRGNKTFEIVWLRFRIV